MNPPSEISSEPVGEAPCNRGEAMELAMRTGVISHLVLCILVLAYLATIGKGLGILVGLGIAAVLASAIPFLVLPVAAAVGFFVHLGLHGTRLSVPLMIRMVVVLLELTLLGWIMVLVIVWGPLL